MTKKAEVCLGGGDDTSIWSGLFLLHLDVGGMSTARVPVKRLPRVKPALLEERADFRASRSDGRHLDPKETGCWEKWALA